MATKSYLSRRVFKIQKFCHKFLHIRKMSPIERRMYITADRCMHIARYKQPLRDVSTRDPPHCTADVHAPQRTDNGIADRCAHIADGPITSPYTRYHPQPLYQSRFTNHSSDLPPPLTERDCGPTRTCPGRYVLVTEPVASMMSPDGLRQSWGGQGSGRVADEPCGRNTATRATCDTA